MEDIKSILLSLNYKLHDDGARFWRAPAIYRNGDNPTALRISKKNGSYVDFVENASGPFYKLVQLSLGLAKPKDAKKWLTDKQYTVQSAPQIAPKIVMAETWDVKILDKLIKDHRYWNERGIKTEIVEQFQGGVAIEGRMEGRYVFPIFNGYEKIVGFTGRDLTDKKMIKWKHIGEKLNWTWPLHLNRENIRAAQEVILVESVGDALKLWQAGFDNCICLFGTYINDKVLAKLVGFNLNKVYISVNNDVDNPNKKEVGNRKACEIYLRLIKFIDKDKIQIKLPLKKDFGEMSEEEILEWKELKNLAVVGTRRFNDYNRLKEVLESYKSETGMVISGGAVGTDRLGKRWAIENKIPCVEFIPEWYRNGKFFRGAGFERNEYIIQNADKAVAVFMPDSRGTQNDIDIAKRLGKPIEIIQYSP